MHIENSIKGSLDVAHVFISYARVDWYFADVLAEKVRNWGFEPWIDFEGIDLGRDWSEEIDKAIRDSFAVLLILSPESKRSDYVTYEWSFALGIGVSVFPIMFRDTELHERLRKIEYADFRISRRGNPEWNAVEKVLKDAFLKHSAQLAASKDFVSIQARFLEDTDEKNRLVAAQALEGRADIARAIPLLRFLDDPNPQIREVLCRTMGKIGDAEALPQLIKLLSDTDASVRQAAVDAIANIGETAVPKLIEFIRDVERVSLVRGVARGRFNAVVCLGMIGSQIALRELLRIAEDDSEDLNVRSVALSQLGRAKYEEVATIALQLLEDTTEVWWYDDKVPLYCIAFRTLAQVSEGNHKETIVNEWWKNNKGKTRGLKVESFLGSGYRTK